MLIHKANSKGDTDMKKKKKLNRRDTGHIQLSYYHVDCWEKRVDLQSMPINTPVGETMREIPRKEKVKPTEKGVGL